MAKHRAGWEKMLYIGTAGSTAVTLVETAVDVNANIPNEFVESTVRGNGTAPPKKTEQLVCRGADPSFSLLIKDGDAVQATILAAVRGGTALAVKVVTYLGGPTEFDGDVYLEADAPGALKDSQVVSFTCHPTGDYRAWSNS